MIWVIVSFNLPYLHIHTHSISLFGPLSNLIVALSFYCLMLCICSQEMCLQTWARVWRCKTNTLLSNAPTSVLNPNKLLTSTLLQILFQILYIVPNFFYNCSFKSFTLKQTILSLRTRYSSCWPVQCPELKRTRCFSMGPSFGTKSKKLYRWKAGRHTDRRTDGWKEQIVLQIEILDSSIMTPEKQFYPPGSPAVFSFFIYCFIYSFLSVSPPYYCLPKSPSDSFRSDGKSKLANFRITRKNSHGRHGNTLVLTPQTSFDLVTRGNRVASCYWCFWMACH